MERNLKGGATKITITRIEINGRATGVEELWYPALVNYGHFTAMQIRGRKVRGLDLHLDRLDAATRELYDTGLDRDRVCYYLRHALRDTEDASVRVNIFSPEENADPFIMVTVRTPAEIANTTQRLESVCYQRHLPHIKHVGTFGLIYYGRRAEQNGFDDALFVGLDGAISETTIANIGFFKGNTIIWPDASVLEGITMQLVERGLIGRDLVSRRRRVTLDDIASFDGAFLTNSLGVARVGQIDKKTFSATTGQMQKLIETYESMPWDSI